MNTKEFKSNLVYPMILCGTPSSSMHLALYAPPQKKIRVRPDYIHPHSHYQKLDMMMQMLIVTMTYKSR